MFRNYLFIALRSVRKSKGHALVNVTGLALGITCSIVIFLIVRFEMSYNNFHDDGNRIFRVVTTFTNSETPGYSAGMTYPLPDALRQDFPDLEYVSIVDGNLYNPVIAVDAKDGEVRRFKEGNVAFVDPDYLKIFKHHWVEGNDNALAGFPGLFG